MRLKNESILATSEGIMEDYRDMSFISIYNSINEKQESVKHCIEKGVDY